MNYLVMPYKLAGFGVQRKHRVAEKIGSGPIPSIEIERRRASGGEDQSTALVDSQTAPSIRAPDSLPGAWRPSLVAELARLRDSVEYPALPAGSHVKSANMTWRRRLRPLA